MMASCRMRVRRVPPGDLPLRQVVEFRPHGGWSLLIDTLSIGLTPEDVSQRLFTRSQVAATPMTGWGPSGEAYLRLVFANEPVERLRDLGTRFDAALN